MTPIRYSLISLALAVAAGGANAQDYYDRGYADDRYSGYESDDRYRDHRYGDDDYYSDGRYYDEPSVDYPVSSNGRYGRRPPAYDVARVTQVSPIVERGRPVQVRECGYEPSDSYASQSRGYGYDDRGYGYDDRGYGYRERARHGARSSGTGTVIGAIAGGVLGNSVGGGDGRQAATVLGAVLGGAIGNEIERNNRYRQDPRSRQVAYRGEPPRERCRVVTRQGGEARVVGYRVDYEYAGRRYQTVTDHHPGSQLRVRVDVTPTG